MISGGGSRGTSRPAEGANHEQEDTTRKKGMNSVLRRNKIGTKAADMWFW